MCLKTLAREYKQWNNIEKEAKEHKEAVRDMIIAELDSQQTKKLRLDEFTLSIVEFIKEEVDNNRLKAAMPLVFQEYKRVTPIKYLRVS